MNYLGNLNSFIVRSALLSGILCYLSFADSSTFDEPSHFASGLYDWNFSGRDLYYVNPPLARMCAALPASWVLDATGFEQIACGRPFRQWGGGVGDDLWSTDARRAELWLAIGRCSLIPFLLLGLWSTETFSNSLYGPLAGDFAGWLYLTCPALLAAGHSIAADGVCAALVVTTCLSFHLWLEAPTMTTCLRAGAALGFALLSKTVVLLLVPLFPIAWLLHLYQSRGSQKRVKPTFCQLAACLALSWAILHGGYEYQGVLVPLREYDFVSTFLAGTRNEEGTSSDKLSRERCFTGNRFRGTLMGHFPVPLPAMYVYGIDRQKADFERSVPTFMHGRWKLGQWDDLIWTALIKLPVGTLCLIVVSSGLTISRWFLNAHFRTSPLLFLSLALMLLVNLSQTGMTIYFRYLVPCLPLLYIQVSRVAGAGMSVSLFWRKVIVVASYSSLCISGLESVAALPHATAFCNVVFGGTWNGQCYYLGVNESGQNLWRLVSWLDLNQPTDESIYVCSTYSRRIRAVSEHDVLECPSLLAVINRIGSGSSDTPLSPGIYITTEFERKSTFSGVGNAYLLMQKPVAWIAPGLIVIRLSENDIELIVNNLRERQR